MALARFCRWLTRRAVRDTDSADERRRKELMLPVECSLLAILVLLEAVFATRAAQSPLLASVLARRIGLVTCTFGALHQLVTRRLTVEMVVATSMPLLAAAMLADLTYAAEQRTFRPWVLVLLAMDLFLALKVPRVYQYIALHGTALWLPVTHIEHGYRLGLYDIDGFSSDGKIFDHICNCSAPPCQGGAASLARWVLPCFVLYIDFFATRGFAEGLQYEQERVQASVSTAERVAEGLAGFDLAVAETALTQAGGGLPPRLSDALSRLLRNLARYRPYLPQSCFEEADEEVPGSTHSSVSSHGSAKNSPRGSGFRPSTGQPGRGSVSSERSSPASTPSSSFNGDGALVRFRHAQHIRRATVLVRNSSGFLTAARKQSDEVQQWLAAEVQRFTDVVSQQNGVTDLFCGDHFSATFGAVKVQGSQCTAATRAAKVLSAPPPAGDPDDAFAMLLPNTAVCCGKALCGDFGSATAQRFMVIGGVAAFAVPAERAAAAWGISVLVSAEVHADAHQLWCCRLRKRVAFAKLSAELFSLWEVLAERLTSGQADEWMYELEAALDNPWEKYNAAVAAWCGAAPRESVLRIIEEGCAVAAPGGEVAGALGALRLSIQGGAPPPVGEFTSGALAGKPSPLGPQ